MVTFQAKIGWKRSRKRKNKNYRFVSFLPNAKQKIPKKQQKNSKTPLWLHFQAKMGWKRVRKRENKNYHYVSFLPDA